VALSDELLRDRGVLATLVLDVVEPGGGQVFQHPKEAVRTYPQADFEQSMQDAWTAAKELAQKGGAQVLFDARWRLQLNEEPVLEVSGRSASGAAARGWWFALTGKVPDEGVIALAQVRADGLLEGVDGVPAKVKAIAGDGRFDTIVVASDENHREAETALRECGKAGVIRVVNIANEQTVRDG
jgi:predicted S18 family serine protease